ncbi:hypothetical protein FKM82_009128 [Ascaphus truei]
MWSEDNNNNTTTCTSTATVGEQGPSLHKPNYSHYYLVITEAGNCKRLSQLAISTERSIYFQTKLAYVFPLVPRILWIFWQLALQSHFFIELWGHKAKLLHKQYAATASGYKGQPVIFTLHKEVIFHSKSY